MAMGGLTAGRNQAEMKRFMLDDGTIEVLEAHARGQLSAPMAAARLLVLTQDVDLLRLSLDQRLPTPLDQAADRILRTLDHHGDAARAMLELLHRDADTRLDVSDPVAHNLQRCRDLFDWAVTRNPEGSVAVYSFGSPQLLDVATAELVSLLDQLGIARPSTRLLDIGCGTGRIEHGLAPLVDRVVGVDLSPEMIAHARQRCQPHPNVELDVIEGDDLRRWGDASFDAVVMVDMVPYLYRVGGTEFTERYLGEVVRVLRPGGQIGIFNLSYRGDPDLDRADAERFAHRYDLHLLRNGIADLQSWDGLTFHFIRRG